MNQSNDIAVLIAGIALGVSFATFIWRIVYDIWFDRPRVKVKVVEGHVGQPPNLVPVYIVSATNIGRRPTSLQSLWLCFGDRFLGSRSSSERSSRRSGSVSR